MKKKEFRTSVWMAVTAVLNLFVYLGTLIAGMITGNAKTVALALVLPIVFWFYFYYTDRLRNWWTARKALSHPDREKLLSLRQSVLGLED
jgi:ABC-type long-subunit fatty acid transport system fused permease/ATPase subunit